MDIQKLLSRQLDNYLHGTEEFQLSGWEEEYTQLGRCPSLKKHRKILRKTFPSRKSHDKIDQNSKTPPLPVNKTITSHLFYPEIAKVTAIKFKGPKECQQEKLSFDKNPRNPRIIPTKCTKPVSRLLIELPDPHPQPTNESKPASFILTGEKSRYYAKKSNRKQFHGFSEGHQPREINDQLRFSMTLPSRHQGGMLKTQRRPKEDWFHLTKDSVFLKVGEQIRSKRCLSQRLTL